jgi:hypothetical protein
LSAYEVKSIIKTTASLSGHKITDERANVPAEGRRTYDVINAKAAVVAVLGGFPWNDGSDGVRTGSEGSSGGGVGSPGKPILLEVSVKDIPATGWVHKEHTLTWIPVETATGYEIYWASRRDAEAFYRVGSVRGRDTNT